MSASESDSENDIYELAPDNDYSNYLHFDSPELQEFYSFYDASRTLVSSEIVVFPRDKLQELQSIFYVKEISAYQRYSHEVQSIQKILRTASCEEDESILESLEARISNLKREVNQLIPRLNELKRELENRFEVDQGFRALLNEWRSAPREVRRIELSPQALAALQNAPRGRYASFQPAADQDSSEEVSPPSSPRPGQSAAN